MDTDILVIGGGISGLSMAFRAVSEGKRALVLERENRLGGCIHTHRLPDGFWFEMGAHTTYNSYGAFLEVLVGSGLADEVVQRGPARAVFGLLREGAVDWLTPPKVLARLNWLEVLRYAPVGVFRRKRGRTMAAYYGGILGPRNYHRVLSPFLAAVPSQDADGFPADGPGSLFKKRPRRKDFPRSYGLRRGLGSLCDAVARLPGVTVVRQAEVVRVLPEGTGFRAITTDGRDFTAPLCAVACPVDQASRVLAQDFPAVALAIARIRNVALESLGVALPQGRSLLPPCAFVVPVEDLFHSAVTRDPFPDPEHRGFAFHFRPGLPRERCLSRMAEVIQVPLQELPDPVVQRLVLPSPALDHGEVVRAIDEALAGSRLAVTGNYFQGLALEDCVQRSFQEWTRITT